MTEWMNGMTIANCVLHLYECMYVCLFVVTLNVRQICVCVCLIATSIQYIQLVVMSGNFHIL